MTITMGIGRIKKVLTALPAGLLDEIDNIAREEHRSRSDLIRESLRQYSHNFQLRQKKLSIASEETASEETE